MSVLWYMALHGLALIGAVVVLAQAPRVRSLTRRRRHDALMARIAKLELVTGVGLDVGHDWLAKQEPRVASRYWSKSDIRAYSNIVELKCLGCESVFTGVGRGELGARLCGTCRSVATQAGVN